MKRIAESTVLSRQVTKFAIIADDLTSATDVGIQFARVGYQVGISFPFEGEPSGDLNCIDVLSVDLDSRTRSGDEARRRARYAASKVASARILFKSIDSTLRGHLAAELSGILEIGARLQAIVAPAFPLTGRTTRDGRQLLNGRPVHETEFAHDPVNPVRESRIAELLRDPTLRPISVLDRWGACSPHEMRKALASSRCVITDADSSEDLQRIVRAVEEPTGVCWVGSPGLGRALGEVFPSEIRPGAALDPCEGLLVVIGSVNSVSRRQLSQLLATRFTQAVELDSKCLLDDSRKSAIDTAVGSAQSALRKRRLVALFTSARRASGSQSQNGEDSEISGPRLIATSLAHVVHEIVQEGSAEGLVIVGGDTASAVLRRLGTVGVRLHAELEPGVPMGQLVGPYPLRIITKAGGFGNDNTLIHACKALMSPGQK